MSASAAPARSAPEAARDTRPYAVLSCDLDTVDRHLQGYGIAGVGPCDRIYRVAVPRLLDLLDELGLRAVLFAIARDAHAERRLLRDAVASGHEIASHSMTHTQPFRRRLDDRALDREIGDSRCRLREAAGTDVIGFRAPAWDVDDRVLRRVAAAGYRYDASVFPTPALTAVRLATCWRGGDPRATFAMDVLGQAFAPAVPHRLRGEASGLVEFPLAVTPRLRLPVYHTVSHLVPARLFARALAALLRSRRPLCYELHAADLLALDDGVDPRLARHPGMRTPLAAKRAALRATLTAIAGRRRVVTYQQALEEGLVA